MVTRLNPNPNPVPAPSWGKWLWWLTPLPVAVAAYWGYHSAAERWPVVGSNPSPAAVAAAASAPALPASAPITATAKLRAKAALAASQKVTAAGPLAAPAAGRPVPGALAQVANNAALKWPLWEFQLKQALPPQNPPLTPPNWRLVGSSNDGKQWQLVILRQGKPEPEFYKVGQELPGKYKIEAITGEDVTLVQRGRRMVLSYIGY
jgi:hypothetical protein